MPCSSAALLQSILTRGGRLPFVTTCLLPHGRLSRICQHPRLPLHLLLSVFPSCSTAELSSSAPTPAALLPCPDSLRIATIPVFAEAAIASTSDSHQEWEEYCKRGSIYLQIKITAISTWEGRKASMEGNRVAWPALGCSRGRRSLVFLRVLPAGGQDLNHLLLEEVSVTLVGWEEALPGPAATPDLSSCLFLVFPSGYICPRAVSRCWPLPIAATFRGTIPSRACWS